MRLEFRAPRTKESVGLNGAQLNRRVGGRVVETVLFVALEKEHEEFIQFV